MSDLKRANGRPAASVYCGRVALGTHVEVKATTDLLTGDVEAFASGTVTCGSVWACPVCSATIRDGRTRQLEAAIGEHLEAGGGLLFGTLTVRHAYGDDLGAMIDGINSAWNRASTGTRAGKAWRERLGTLGVVRSLEITYGRNGWHPHLHVLIFTEKPVSADERDAYSSWLGSSWGDYVETMGMRRPSAQHGVRLEAVGSAESIGRYLAKVQDDSGEEVARPVAQELMRGDLKQSRRKGLVPFQLLDLCDDDDERTGRQARRLWHEYEKMTQRRRAVTGLTPLLKLYGLDAADEDELAQRDPSDEPETSTRVVLLVERQTWQRVCMAGLEVTLLEAVETGGAWAGEQVLHEAEVLARAIEPPDRVRLI